MYYVVSAEKNRVSSNGRLRRGCIVATNRDVASTTRVRWWRSPGPSAGQLLLAYKLNWQSGLFAGYGDDRELTDRNELVTSPGVREDLVRAAALDRLVT